MLYDSYYKKISKIADFWKKVFKHIVLICIALGLILATIIAFMVVKGMVFDDKNQSESIEITYGGALSLNSNALFSDVVYEYSDDDGKTWSSQPPIFPGEYKVRSVSNGIFGQSRYGKVYSLTISPKEIEVNVVEKEILYGELLSVSADLSYGDTVYCDNFIYEDISKQTTSVLPDIEAVKILNEDGEDITFAYSIKPVSATVSLQPREILFVVEDKGTVYNGVKFSFDGYELSRGTLAYEDSVKAVFNKYLVDVGEIENTPEIRVFNKDGIDVSLHYVIDKQIGTLSVDYRPIVIESDSAQKIYDGAAFNSYAYEVVEGSIAEGQTITCISGPSITEVGSIDNALSFEITDGEGKDVTSNYSIIYALGTLDVTPRPIKIQTASQEKVYDAQELSNSEFTIIEGALVEGHVITCVSDTTVTNVGEIENKLSFELKDGEGSDKISNYDITYDFGILKITPRTLSVTTESGFWIYDGSYHTANVNYSGACEGHEIRATEPVMIIDAGTAENTVEVLGIYDAEGNAVIENYEIAYGDLGTLEIAKRKVALTMESAELDYDGQEYSFINYDITSEYCFLDGDEFRFKVDAFSEANEEGYENKPYEYSVYSNDRDMDVTDNYELEITSGTIIIRKFVINFELFDKEKYYDGTPLEFSAQDVGRYYTMTPKTLPNNHILDISFIGSITDVGDYSGATVSREKTKIWFEDKDVTANFKINSNSANLKVKQCVITVITPDGENIYDGTTFTNDNYTVKGLIEGYTLEFSAPTESSIDYTENGVENKVEVTAIYNQEKKELDLKNFDIEYVFGVLKILKRPIAITTESAEIEYDGTAYSFDDYTVTSELKFVEGDSFSEFKVNEFSEANENGYNNEVLSYKIYSNTRNVEVTNNYIIEKTLGKVVIHKFKLTVELSNKEKNYDGTPLEFTTDDYRISYPVTPESLPEGHTLQLAFDGSQTEVGKSKASLNLDRSKVDFNGKNVISNFEISSNVATLTVLPAEDTTITLRPKDVVGDYNGVAYKATVLDENSDSTVNGLVELGYAVSYTFTGERILVGESKSWVANVTITRGGEDVTDWFNVVCESGTIIVNKCAVEITLPEEKVALYNGRKLVLTKDDCTISGLPSNHSIELVFVGSQTEVGESEASVHSVEVSYNGTSVLLDNFDLKYINGNKSILRVEQRVITIKANDKAKVYDGKALGPADAGYSIIDEEDLSQSDIESLFDINLSVTLNGDSVTDAGEYSTVTPTYSISGKDHGENIKFECETGKLSVTKRIIIITSKSDSKPYDGTPLTAMEYTFEDNGGLTEETIEALLGINIDVTLAGSSITDKGRIDNLISSVSVTDRDGRDLTQTSQFRDNIQLVIEYGTLEIFERVITISTGSADKIYDGEELVCYDYSVSDINGNDADALSEKFGITVNVEFWGEIVNAGETSNEAYASIEGENSQNFRFEYQYGTLSVTPRKIIVTTDSATKIYDSTPLTCDKYTVQDVKGADEQALKDKYGISVSVDVTGTITDVGMTDNEATAYILGENPGNFEIAYELGTLIVLEPTIQPLDVMLSTVSKIYDGEALDAELMFRVLDEDFLNSGYSLEYVRIVMPGEAEELFASHLNPDSEETKLTYLQYCIIDKDGNDVTSSFYLNVISRNSSESDCLVAQILPRELEITTGSEEKYYTEGAKLSNSSVMITKGTLASGESLVISENRILVVLDEVGIEFNELSTFDVSIFNGDKNVTKNYNITIVAGVLEFLP